MWTCWISWLENIFARMCKNKIYTYVVYQKKKIKLSDKNKLEIRDGPTISRQL